MFKTLLIVLVVLFAGQTIVPTFDSHIPLQPDNVHFSVDKLHDDHQALVNDTSEHINNSTDCHHCCHCHAPANVFILGSHVTLVSNTLEQKKINLISSFLSRHVSPEYRPPIIS